MSAARISCAFVKNADFRHFAESSKRASADVPVRHLYYAIYIEYSILGKTSPTRRHIIPEWCFTILTEFAWQL